MTETTACVVVGHPNFFGLLEDVRSLAGAAHDAGALFVSVVDPISLGLLERPGSYGADLVVAEGQALGNPMAFGGPYLGIMACREEYMRRLPGRIVGETVDGQGRRAFVLTLQNPRATPSDGKRQRATSAQIRGCSRFAPRFTWPRLGPKGMREIATLCCQKAHYAANRLSEVDGLSLRFGSPFFKEFVVQSSQKEVVQLLDSLGKLGFHGGAPLGRWYPELKDCYLLAVTEKRSRCDIDGFVAATVKSL